MDVPQNHYWKQLLSILIHIANAKYVAFDLEMSGIAVRSPFGTNPKGHDNGKPSLQALYDEVRAAAELYQVLQVGITCVEEDREKGFYLARPFNFNMTPLLYLENKVKDRFPERKIVFSSSATDFLQNQAGFDIGKVFREGVYYLSHADEEETRQRFRDRMERDLHPHQDAVLPTGDKDILDFQRYVRKTISEWVNAEKQEYGFVNVADPQGGELNGFQRMLVHQLVRNEFPGYRSFPRGNQSFVQIEKLNEKKEDQFKAKKSNDFSDAVAKQIGLRWIFEALSGGEFEGFRTNLLTNEYADDPELSQTAIDEKFEEVKTKLKNKEHILVGHNLFTDLVCVYKTFIGPLPLMVEDFQNRIHSLFPVVFDTKYIVTEGENSMSTVMRKNLEELVTPFTNVHTTRFILHEEHTAYGSSLSKKHEAGFDSYMTAHLFAKISTNLFAKRKLTEDFDAVVDGDSDEDDEQELDDGDDGEDDDENDLTYHTAFEDSSISSKTGSDADFDGGAKLIPRTPEDDLLGSADETNTHGNSSVELCKDNLSTSGKTSNSDHKDPMSDNLPPSWHADQMQNSNLDDNNPYAVLTAVDEDDGSRASSASLHDGQQWIPKMSSSFWRIYINKLRVNACESGVCDLNEALE